LSGASRRRPIERAQPAAEPVRRARLELDLTGRLRIALDAGEERRLIGRATVATRANRSYSATAPRGSVGSGGAQISATRGERNV
jgi:hypothetical protein